VILLEASNTRSNQSAGTAHTRPRAGDMTAVAPRREPHGFPGAGPRGHPWRRSCRDKINGIPITARIAGRRLCRKKGFGIARNS